MRIRSVVPASLSAAVVITGLVACSQDRIKPLTTAPGLGGSAGMSASSKLVTPPFSRNNFVAGVNNPYFPLPVGKTFTYRETSKEGPQTNTVEVTGADKTILGVAVTVVHDRVYIADGSLLEDTFDWYAQDKQGNVWYFGEDTKEYDHGTLVTTQGSWEAGKNGARPGIIMLAHPHVGDIYKQEDAPGVVEDMGKVVSLAETVSVPYGHLPNCLETTEWTPIEPGNRSHKFYAPGVGNVLEVSTRQGGARLELLSVK